ncbi:MAG TPA: glutamyl-tRNA reductase [Opitutaceae bacterium]|nr:glutamyl-tRNA reductase [Opitutaceae bacterium]
MSAPKLFLVGATHRTAPLEFREKLALGPEAEEGFARDLAAMNSVREFAVLNTCNRVEIYGVASEEGAPGQVAAAFCARQRVESSEFGRFGFVAHGRDVVRHLFEVASGLDSQILGETEIFGQVKRAYAAAQARGSVRAVLNRVFQKAFQAAKHVRTNTAVTAGQVSVANVAVDLAQDIFGSLGDARVLLVGAGEMARRSGRAFASRGAVKLTVSSRSVERAGQLAGELGAGVLRFEERESRLSEWDVVVCSTSAPGTVISAGAVRSAMRDRGARPILFIDLAMPRDVDGEVADAGNLFLYNLDDLAQIAEKNRLARAAEAERGRLVLALRAESIWSQLQAQTATGGAPGERLTPEAPVQDRGLRAPAFA